LLKVEYYYKLKRIFVLFAYALICAVSLHALFGRELIETNTYYEIVLFVATVFGIISNLLGKSIMEMCSCLIVAVIFAIYGILYAIDVNYLTYELPANHIIIAFYFITHYVYLWKGFKRGC